MAEYSARQTPRGFLTEFIEMYRSFTCLWLVKSKEYSDRHKKDRAYMELVKKYQEYDPLADRTTVVKKIAALRTVYKKELSRVHKSEQSATCADDIYKPSLWYFDLLHFLEYQDSARLSKSTINDADQEMTSFKQEESQNETSLTFEHHTSSQLASPPSPVATWSDSALSCQTILYEPPKKSKIGLKRKQGLDADLRASKETDEFDGIGLNVACKLRRMDEEQKLHAEFLISKVLMNGLKGRLQEETNLCALKFIPPPAPDQKVNPNSVDS